MIKLVENELALVEKIENKLRKPLTQTVFPLTPTHRKELRQLREQNIGGLKRRLGTVKQLKKDEYIAKYKDVIKKELSKSNKIAIKLNEDWAKRVSGIRDIINERMAFEKKYEKEIVGLQLNKDYGGISNLEVKDSKREYFMDFEKASNKKAEAEFLKKYDEPFKQILDKIDKLTTMYEEAINFGDLELVRQLYFEMKSADKFFEKIDELDM